MSGEARCLFPSTCLSSESASCPKTFVAARVPCCVACSWLLHGGITSSWVCGWEVFVYSVWVCGTGPHPKQSWRGLSLMSMSPVHRTRRCPVGPFIQGHVPRYRLSRHAACRNMCTMFPGTVVGCGGRGAPQSGVCEVRPVLRQKLAFGAPG